MPRKSTRMPVARVAAEGLTVRCPKCGRLQPTTRGMLQFIPADLLVSSKLPPMRCIGAEPKAWDNEPACDAVFIVPFPKLVPLEAP